MNFRNKASTSRHLFWAGFTVAMSVLLIGCGAGGTESSGVTFVVGDSPRLVLGAGHGEVLVQVGPTNAITVESVVSAKDNVEIDVTAEGDVVTARTITTFSGNLIGDKAQGSVDFTITVPPLTVIEVGTGSGPVIVEDVQNGGVITASAGKVTLRRVSGDFSGGTGVGDVTITDSNGSFQFTTGVGGISFDGELANGGSNEFEAGVGDVTVSLSLTAGVVIDAAVTTGAITKERSLTDEVSTSTIAGGRLTGTFGDGGADLRINVGVGSVLLK